ncbi:MAG: undecaprenyl-diphosphate phosphatase [Gemmatimonadetes bacterium]|nr:undecaprenyl-diphosphate phosphatase [Gemmatimonadota bacterium]
MNPIDALILGVVQGLTEFLPISSDGHLALAENLLGLRASGAITGIFLDVAVHVATLAAILIAFREPIIRLATGALKGERRAWADVGLYAVGSVPAAVVGFLARHQMENLYRSLLFIGAAFIVMGCILWSARGRMNGTRERPNLWEAFAIGVGQAAAIAPAISRSGCTITTALWRGMDPVRAAEFSFVLGVPAIAGAALLELRDLSSGIAQIGAVPLAVAFTSAFASGLFAIDLLRRLLRARAFHRFAPYLWVLGATTLAIAAVRGGS